MLAHSAVVARAGIVYSRLMASVSDVRGSGTGASQHETSPIPLEFVVVSRMKRQSQDETSPFLLEFQVASRKKRQSQEETSPFLLEFEVTEPDAEPSRPAVARARQGRAEEQPRAQRRIDAAAELCSDAARFASRAGLPQRGVVRAEERSSETARTPQRAAGSAAKTCLKLALGLLVVSALPVASAVLGDDATLRAAGQSISRWFTGDDRSFQTFAPTAPRSGVRTKAAVPQPCVATATAPSAER